VLKFYGDLSTVAEILWYATEQLVAASRCGLSDQSRGMINVIFNLIKLDE
jgi:hypothetical protein